MSLRKKLKARMALTAHADYVGLSYHNLDFCDTEPEFRILNCSDFYFNSAMKFYTMYFISSLSNHVYIFIRCINFSTWLGLACIVLFLISTVHSYVSANFK